MFEQDDDSTFEKVEKDFLRSLFFNNDNKDLQDGRTHSHHYPAFLEEQDNKKSYLWAADVGVWTINH